MISKSLLHRAAQQNIIEPGQVDPLYQFIQNQESDELIDCGGEPLKFVRGFGDVFITLGIVLLVVAINLSNLSGYNYLIPVAGFIGLSEWLVRVRKLALPGIAILISILFFVNKAVPFGGDNTAFIGLAVVSVTSLAFYYRYKMPFSLLPLAASLVAMIAIQIGVDVLQKPVLFVVFGMIVFAIAFWFDSQDTVRKSHLSDNAFWLYLLASPLIVHGVMVSLLISDQAVVVFLSNEVLMIVFFLMFFLLALLIDRRAILISTQLYVIYALTQILQEELSSSQNVLIYILVGLGLFVIYFGTYWYKSRRMIFGSLKGGFICRYIPDFNTEDVMK